MMRCAISYHFYNVKNLENTHEGVLHLVKLQAESNPPSWVLLTFFKLYKWGKIAERITYYHYGLKLGHFLQIHLNIVWDNQSVYCLRILISALFQNYHQLYKYELC